jgi:hypothetical protein
LDDPLAEIFNDGRFSETYFSLGAVPKHDDDWKFWRSHTEQILVCDGGNIDASELQLSYLRIVAKQSDATRLFNALKRKLTQRMTRGGLSTDGDDSGRLYYSESALEYKLMDGQCERRRT